MIRTAAKPSKLDQQRALLGAVPKPAAPPAPNSAHELDLAKIQVDGGTQSRAELNHHVVDDYAEAIRAGATFPSIVVFYDGKKHWLADGFHRFHAYQKARCETVAADIRQGTRRDAILHSVGANDAHGLRRTNDDKRRAVLTLLNDAEWSKWTDREIAACCRVDHKTVGKVRSEVSGEIPSERTYVTKHGTTATMNTAGINAGRMHAPKALANDEPSPEAGPQAEASLVGTDTGTPADREGRIDGEAASVDLPTISAADQTEREYEAIQAAWNAAGDPARGAFLMMNGLSGSTRRPNESQAKAPEDNGSTAKDHDEVGTGVTGGVSRQRQRRRDGGERPAQNFGRSTGAIGEATISDGSQGQDVDVGARLATATPEKVEDGEKDCNVPDPSSDGGPIPGTAGSIAPCTDSTSDGDAFSEVKGKARPENANGVEPSSSVPNHNAAAPAFVMRPSKPLRPHCLKPDLCAGSGKKHCHQCSKAAKLDEAAA